MEQLTSKGLRNRAALIAAVITFSVGILGSLALRPHAITGERTQKAGTVCSEPGVSRRVPMVCQSNLAVPGDNPIYITRQVEAARDGALRTRLREPGEPVPAPGITYAVRDKKVEPSYTGPGYDQGEISASALHGAAPFGMDHREYSAWSYEAASRELAEALYSHQNIHLIYCGMTDPEMAGWFRNTIVTLQDLRGLKIRFPGIGGKVIDQPGVSVTMLPGGESFQEPVT